MVAKGCTPEMGPEPFTMSRDIGTSLWADI
jgi:hypothetical protein